MFIVRDSDKQVLGKKLNWGVGLGGEVKFPWDFFYESILKCEIMDPKVLWRCPFSLAPIISRFLGDKLCFQESKEEFKRVVFRRRFLTKQKLKRK